MSREDNRAVPAGERFPRVSGDEPTAVSWIGSLPGFSPRERG